jgi:hypothetical protein
MTQSSVLFVIEVRSSASLQGLLNGYQDRDAKGRIASDRIVARLAPFDLHDPIVLKNRRCNHAVPLVFRLMEPLPKGDHARQIEFNPFDAAVIKAMKARIQPRSMLRL